MYTHNDLLTKMAGQAPASETNAIGDAPDGRVISPIELQPPYCDESKLAERLRKACSETLLQGPNGCSIKHGSPRRLWDELLDACTPWAREAYDNAELDEEDLLERPYPRHNLLAFHWQSIGPCMFSAYIFYRVIEDQVFFHVDVDWGEFVVAVAVSGDTSDAARFFVEDFFRSNVHNYGLGLFGTLPTLTENYAPAIVPPALLAQCYFDVMNWIAHHFDDYAWAQLEETLISEKATPDMQTLVIDLLKRYTNEGYIDSIRQYHAERTNELEDRAKAFLINQYFSQSYSVMGQ